METYLLVSFVLIALGICAMVGEFFFPTGGLLLIVALVLFAGAVGYIWYAGTQTEATVAVIGFCVGVPAMGWGMVQAWKSLALKRGLDPEAAGGSITQALPELSELEQLKGQIGTTVTPMRPSGAVSLGGRRVDAMTEGMMLEPGVRVRCVDVKAGRVIVRRADGPARPDDLNFDPLT